MKLFIFFIIDLFIFILSAAISKGEDAFMFIGCVSMLAIPVFIIIFIVKGAKFLFKKIKTFEIQTPDNSNNKVVSNENNYEIAKYYQACANDEFGRVRRAKYENFTIKINNNNTAIITNASKTNSYRTTLTSCSCPDFIGRQLPCKHMYRLAGKLNYYELYRLGEQETIQKLNILWEHKNLVPYLIDIFYRIRDKKNKYFIKITPNIKKLQELNLIILKDIAPAELAEWKYNTNELRGLLYDKGIKKNTTRKSLIELFVNDDKLVKKLPKNIKHVMLNFEDSQNENIIDCLNYINYND